MTEPEDNAPTDGQYEPKPKESAAWLGMISEAQKKFQEYQDACKRVEKIYANLSNLSATLKHDRDFQLFWANCEVMKPSIYSRPPIPVVSPRFKDRRPLYRTASELLERTAIVGFEIADINSTMILLRDDLAINARGTAWVRYEDKGGKDERVLPEWVYRDDFLHEPARAWCEVGWVARRSWMTRDELRERFSKHSGNAYLDVPMTAVKEDRDTGAATTKQRKGGVWELWSKTEKKVVWVAEGCSETLEESEPHLKLDGFFPCPKPAFGTTEPGSLMPVPDMFFYRDQLVEIEKLTNRIHALCDSLKVRGFYAAGGADIGDAIEAAIKKTDDRQILIGVPSIAAFGTGGDAIVWLPIEAIANTIQICIGVRRQIIEDVYQISGISDVQRGETDPNETLGAQQLKQQNGAVRIRDKQNELVRVARDLVRIGAEIMAENFSQQTMLDMSQMEIPTNADIAKQVKPLEDQAKAITAKIQQAQADPRIAQKLQQDPEMAQQAQQALQEAQGQVQQIMQQIEKLQGEPTIEQIMGFLHEQRLRPFVLDIETDSTIQVDENAEKAARAEFSTALATLIAQFAPVLQMSPAMAPMVGSIIKFTLAPFRVGRELEGQIDEAVEGIISQSQQPQPNPEAEALQAKAQAEQQKMQFDMQMKQVEAQTKQAEAQMKQEEWQREQQNREREWQYEREDKAFDYEAKLAQTEADMRFSAQQHQQAMEKGALDVRKAELGIVNQQEQARINAEAKARDVSMRETAAESNESRAERAFERESAE
jgi:hypothetical protein